MKKFIKIICITAVSVIGIVGCGTNEVPVSTPFGESVTVDVGRLTDETVEIKVTANGVTGTEEQTATPRARTAKEIEEKEAGIVRYSKGYYVPNGTTGWISEYGFVYEDKFYEQMWCTSADYGEKSIFCHKIGCKHDKSTVSYRMPACNAATDEEYMSAYYEGNLYYFRATNGNSSHRIYKIDMESGERTILAELPCTINPFSPLVFSGDYLYYGLWDMQKGGIAEYGILMELSLIDGTYRYMVMDFMDWPGFDIAGDTLYVRVRDAGNSNGDHMSAINIHTLEETVILTEEEQEDMYSYVAAYDEDSFYCYDKVSCEICIRNINGELEERIIRSAMGEEFGKISASCEGVMYTRKLDYEDEYAGTFFKDMETGEVTNITKVAELYKLTAYDGYYDVFIGENEAGGYCNVYTREKILSEARVN